MKIQDTLLLFLIIQLPMCIVFDHNINSMSLYEVFHYLNCNCLCSQGGSKNFGWQIVWCQQTGCTGGYKNSAYQKHRYLGKKCTWWHLVCTENQSTFDSWVVQMSSTFFYISTTHGSSIDWKNVLRLSVQPRDHQVHFFPTQKPMFFIQRSLTFK